MHTVYQREPENKLRKIIKMTCYIIIVPCDVRLSPGKVLIEISLNNKRVIAAQADLDYFSRIGFNFLPVNAIKDEPPQNAMCAQ